MMRLLIGLLLALVLAAPRPASADAAHVQGECVQNAAATANTTFDATVPTGSLIWVGVNWSITTDDDVTVAVTDNSGSNTYTAGTRIVNAGVGGSRGFYVLNGANGAHQVTAAITDVTGSVSVTSICIAEATGVAAESPLDDEDGGQGDSVPGGTGLDVGTLTTTTTGGIAYTTIHANTGVTYTVPASYTSGGTAAARAAVAYRVTGGPGAYGATWTWPTGSFNVSGVHMAFKSDGSGPAPSESSLLLLGVQ